MIDFPFGDPTLRSELAIEALCQSLTDASETQIQTKYETCYQISRAFLLRRVGTARENVESAIRWANRALDGAAKNEGQPTQCDATLLLGELYIARLEGERTTNLDMAEKYYLEAAKLVDKDRDPNRWCRARLGWANVLTKLVLRYRTQRLTIAMAALTEVLKKLEQHPDNSIELECQMLLGVSLAT